MSINGAQMLSSASTCNTLFVPTSLNMVRFPPSRTALIPDGGASHLHPGGELLRRRRPLSRRKIEGREFTPLSVCIIQMLPQAGSSRTKAMPGRGDGRRASNTSTGSEPGHGEHRQPHRGDSGESFHIELMAAAATSTRPHMPYSIARTHPRAADAGVQRQGR